MCQTRLFCLTFDWRQIGRLPGRSLQPSLIRDVMASKNPTKRHNTKKIFGCCSRTNMSEKKKKAAIQFDCKACVGESKSHLNRRDLQRTLYQLHLS